MSTFISLISRSRPGATAGLALLALVANAWGASEPAQVPLTSRVAEPPTPNVMLTIDDSGSMLADFMPEGTFKLNGYNVNLANDWVGGFPADWRKLCTSGQKNCVAGTWPTGNYLAGVVTSRKTGASVYEMQYRSPDVNKIYYNPDLLYLPWYKSDGSGDRMPNATLSAAKLDPVISNGTFNLSINYTLAAGNQITTNWFTGPGTKKVIGRDFYPGLVYRLTAGANPTATGSYTRYDINATDGSHAPSLPSVNRTDCMANKVYVKCTLAQEQQNFANWFTYYRMRESLTKAAVSESFVIFKDKLRVGWGRINKNNSDTIDGASFKVVETETNGGPMRPLDGNRLGKVLTGVQKLASWPSTPLRVALDEVGRYFFVDDGVHSNVRPAAGSPWLTDPANEASEKLTCRRSVSLLMTDGYYNDSYTAAGDVDGTNGPSYTGTENPGNYSPTEYVAQRPYIDAPNALSNTLADVASRYYVMDMDTTIANKVPPVSGDIAYWQHLTQFMVGLGVYGTLDSSTPEAKSETLKQITAGTKNWPDPASGSSQKIDDMWHAAVNTGGDFYSVSNVTELTEALKDAFGRAAGNEAKEAGVATASSTLVADNVKYVPKYKSVSWFGDLEAWALDIDGNTPDFPTWRASEKLPAHGSRNLFTWVGSDAIEFTSGKSSVVELVGSKELVDYIRGDTSKEGDGQAFRSRRVGVTNQLLGDFVDSPPVVVKGLLDLGYAAFDASYADYLAQKQARTDSAIVLGGNAGMVHAFRGSDGVEVFGYLPQEGLSNLPIIASKDYGTTSNFHRFFVNGPMNETDAKIDDQWTNLVLGAMGSGGKTFFALRFPTDFGATLDAADLGKSAVLWEKSGKDDGDIGYMFADFAVGKIKGGGWKAFIGNGVYSSNGNSVLLVVDIKTGAIDKITVDSSGNTGMMGVSLIKDATTREVLGAYAGDLKGNVWRFDFEGASSADWKVGFSGEPLFVAMNAGGDRLPITVPPVFVLHPTKGRVVLVGTGRLIDTVDSDSIDKQTFFGVWDNVPVGEFSSQAVSPFYGQANGRDKLQEQKVNLTPLENTAGGIYYSVETTPVNWTSQLGWLMDLPFEGQRVLYPSLVLGLDYVFFSTVVPARDVAQCESSSGKGYNYLLVAADGTQPTSAIFDTDGNGVVDESDQAASGFETKGDGRDAIVNDKDDPLIGGDLKDGSNGSDGDGSGGKGKICNTEGCEDVDLKCISNCPPPPGANKAVVDRVWKQIMNPPKPE
ncbi:MAG: hypothetical protein IV094_01780 [Vitreoscilla sp.]|nr:hypothetical protein [Vitreoscilla sp.]